MAMRMRQSLAQIEEEFRESMEREHSRARRCGASAVSRTRKRTRERRQKRSSMRFWLLVASLIATAIAVTVAMFETLYYLLG